MAEGREEQDGTPPGNMTGENEGAGEAQPSLSGLFARLADDAARLVRAEIELQRAGLMLRLALARPAIAGLVACVMLAQAALICLLVMLAIALSDCIGPLGAGLAVTAATLVLAGLLAFLSLRRLKRVSEEDEIR